MGVKKMKAIKKNITGKVFLVIILITMISKIVSAQQDPMYTQYMFNTQTINPAYAGTWDAVGFMVLARQQWVGIENAPSTQTFSFQMPLKNEKVGIGLNIVNDKVGFERRFGVFADYSYKIKFEGLTNLRFGLKGGFTNYRNNLSEHILNDPNDPAFVGEIDHKFLPNVGVGLLLENPNYYVGISVPKLVNSQYEATGNNFAVQGELRHFFLIAGYVYTINDDFKFKPTVLAKATIGAPLQLDFTANLLLKDKLWLGAMYRTGDSFGFIAQWIFDKKLRVGYAIDFTTSNLRSSHYSTHEIMLSYELKILKQKIISPRYF
jgi:type IX secretion system PorP/SprF family membrane protein